MIVSLIVAIGKNRQIGKDNQMLWHVPEDFKNFKKITMGHHMVMGRKTFESIGKPLPGRTTLILTHDKHYQQDGCTTVHSVDEALRVAREAGEDELFVCGGAQIYDLFLEFSNKLYLSSIDYDGEADTFFPQFDHFDWQAGELINFPATEKSPAWSFQILSK